MSPTSRATLLSLLLCLLATAANAAIVRGTVTSAAGGSALSGMTVSAYDASGALRGTTTTDASGQYTLTLPAGSYRVLAYDNSGTYATVFYGNAESFETSAFVQATETAIVTANFALPRGGTVGGVVLASGAPLANAIVEAYNLSGTRRAFTTTNASGQYSLVLPAGDYKIFAYDANGVFAGEFAGNVRAFSDAAPVRVNPPASTDASFVLERAARVTGSVVDADTRAPLAGKLVYAYTAAGSLVATTTTDASGAFRFHIGPGQYRFVAGDPERLYAPAFYATSGSFEQSDVVTLAAGEQRSNVTLAATRGAVVSGRISGGAGLLVAAYNVDGTLHTTARANEAGEYALVVAPGEYKLALIDPAGVYATLFYPSTTSFFAAAEIAILAGQTLQAIDFTAARAGRFTGTVRDANTLQPLGGMTVAAYDATGALVAQTTTAANGTYTLAVAPGQYRVVAFDTRLDYATSYAGGAPSYEATVPLTIAADATNTADFTMRRGTRVTGYVVDPNGAGIENAEVFALDASGNRVAGARTSGGAFTFVVAPGTYNVIAIDPSHRFTRSGSMPLVVGSTSPAPVTIVLAPTVRRRSVRR